MALNTTGFLVPDWPAPAHVRALCSTRAGGVSHAPYDSLNLGDHVGDEPAAVATNRQRYAEALGARPVFLKQVHGWDVAVLTADAPDGTEADACLTQVPGLACTMMVADCLPLLITDTEGRAVAAAHAGWRGLAGQGGRGVVEAVLERFGAVAGVQQRFFATELIAWLGPCIGPEAFEVGAEVRQAFVSADPAAASHFRPLPAHASGEPKFLANLPALARQRMQAAGVSRVYGNDGSPAWCTVANPSRFFSHRRDRVSGRFAASIWLGA